MAVPTLLIDPQWKLLRERVAVCIYSNNPSRYWGAPRLKTATFKFLRGSAGPYRGTIDHLNLLPRASSSVLREITVDTKLA
jgi:hypothetical protein